MKILITGAAGYIGSHTLRQFLKTEHEICALDNFSKGSIRAINDLQKIREFCFFELDLSDFAAINALFEREKFDAVIHFAACIEVFESVQNPLKYYLNNTVNTTNLIQACLKNGTNRFIFSSTAAVYGEPGNEKVSESSPLVPINPYGRSKLMSEEVLRDASRANPKFKHCILRYFNVAGACMDFKIGQRYPKATLLIKIAAEVATKKRDKIYIYGTDYASKDGSCVRDFIHVDDIASAHLAGLEYLENNSSEVFNVGYSQGFSVFEVIETMKEISGFNFKTQIAPRREGDPSILIADNSKILKLTSWRPKFNDLKLICKSAFEWEKYC